MVNISPINKINYFNSIDNEITQNPPTRAPDCSSYHRVMTKGHCGQKTLGKRSEFQLYDDVNAKRHFKIQPGSKGEPVVTCLNVSC